jgi:hypothetical protein
MRELDLDLVEIEVDRRNVVFKGYETEGDWLELGDMFMVCNFLSPSNARTPDVQYMRIGAASFDVLD